jgi:hypothetical protein
MDLDLWQKFARVTEFHTTDAVLAAYRLHDEAKCFDARSDLFLEMMDLCARSGFCDSESFWGGYRSFVADLCEEQRRFSRLIGQYERSRWLKAGRVISRMLGR